MAVALFTVAAIAPRRVGDTKRGPSPTLRGRVSEADYAAFQKTGTGHRPHAKRPRP